MPATPHPALTRAQEIGPQRIDVRFAPDTYDAETHEVTLVFGTETPVLRYYWDERYKEVLSFADGHCRLDLLNAGAPFLDSHNRWDTDYQIGKVVRAWIENNQGYCRVRFRQNHTRSQDVEAGVAQGILDKVSVGYRIFKMEESTGLDGEVPTLRAVDWQPYEVSMVPVPADWEAGTRSAERGAETMNQVQIHSFRTMSAEATGAPAPNAPEAGAGEGTRAAATPQPPAKPALNEEQIRAAEIARVKGIRETVRQASLPEAEARSLEDDLIDKGVSLDEARKAVLDKWQKHDVATRGHKLTTGEDEADKLQRAAVDGMANRVNPGAFKAEDEKVRAFAQMSLLDICRDVLERAGVNTKGMGKHDLVERALTHQSRNHSTADFPLLMSNVASKFLQQGYTIAPQQWRAFAALLNLPDFKQATGIQFGGAAAMPVVAEGGEFERTSLRESGETYRLRTFGQIVALTRQAIINDDLNGFARLAQELGKMAAQTETNAVYALLTANSGNGVTMSDGKALFHADHSNLATGGAVGTISTATLATARNAMRRQKGLKQEVLNLTPVGVIVPPELETEAEKILSTLVVPSKEADVNVFRSRLQIIAEPYLANANAWYVFADPAQLASIVYGYLQGQQGLYTETRTGFEVDGIQVKARLDFGAAVMDYRGFYRNPGA